MLGLNNNKIDRSSKLTKDDSHSYEEVCCNRQINCQQKGVAKDDSHIYETIYYGQPNGTPKWTGIINLSNLLYNLLMI